MSDDSCPCCEAASPAATALALLAETHELYTNLAAVVCRICPHIAEAVVAVLRARDRPTAVEEAFSLMQGGDFCAPLRPALECFLATCGDVTAFAAMLMAWAGDGRKAVELLDAGPWRELVAPEPDLGRRLRAESRDARSLLEHALRHNDLALAGALMDRGVDPTLCVCEPGTVSWCECQCDETEGCGCVAQTCYCNLVERFQSDLRTCTPEALRELLRRGCRLAEAAWVGSSFVRPAVSLFGELVLHGRREHLEALLEFEDVDTRVWEAREPWLDPLDVTSVELREFALRAGAGWAVELLDRAARWSPGRRAWIGAVLRAPRPAPAP